jgi:nucleoid-associated protein YgaU
VTSYFHQNPFIFQSPLKLSSIYNEYTVMKPLIAITLMIVVTTSAGCLVQSQPAPTPRPAAPAIEIEPLITFHEDISTPVSQQATVATGVGQRKITANGQQYVIKSGDTLYGLARRFYGDASMWRQIVQVNKSLIPDPNNIIAGTRIILPQR